MNAKRHIYVASSWRNRYYPEVVEKLREAELMYKLFSRVCCSIEEVLESLK